MKKIYLFIIFSVSIASSYAQRIQNIVAQNNGNEIIINYDISDIKYYQTLNLSLYVSKDDGKSWIGPLEHIEGDIGKIETVGTKSIIWDVLKELQVMEENFIFDVRADVLNKKIPKRIFAEIVGNDITPIGLRVGLLGKTGLYIEGRASAKLNASSHYHYTNNLITNYDRSGYYNFNGNAYYDAFSVSAGISKQINRNAYVFGGLGYGSQRYIAEIDQYEYANNNQVGNEFAVNTEEDYSGAVLSTGLIINSKNIIFSAGGTSLNFQVFNFTIGAGLLF